MSSSLPVVVVHGDRIPCDPLLCSILSTPPRLSFRGSGFAQQPSFVYSSTAAVRRDLVSGFYSRGLPESPSNRVPWGRRHECIYKEQDT